MFANRTHLLGNVVADLVTGLGREQQRQVDALGTPWLPVIKCAIDDGPEG